LSTQRDSTQRELVRTLISLSALVSTAAFPSSTKAEEPISRADVGFINLNETEPRVTDVAWLDVKIGDSPGVSQRLEFNLYGDIVPETVKNFKELCRNGGYKGSEFFRIIGQFSVQAGNLGQPEGTPLSKLSRFGRAANNGGTFPPENFRILHSYRDGGVVSMMKDITNKGLQDSRFFITLSPNAEWADGKYSAFARLKSGMSFVNGISIIPVVPPSNYPETRIVIVDSGIY